MTELRRDGIASIDADAAPPVEFVSVFHGNEADEDDGVETPVGFQDTPDQWYSARQKKRGVTNTLLDAPTQPESEATQPQSVATEVQSFAAAGTVSGHGPSFVAATGYSSSAGDDSGERRDDDIDEDETQIMMSPSQDRETLRMTAQRIEEEELETSKRMPAAMGSDNSDAESDMSDDMLAQDGDIDGLSSIAKNFQQSDTVDRHAEQLRKPSAPVYRPRTPFQVSPPQSVVGVADDSSGGETEVEEEPKTVQATAPASPPPAVLDVSVKDFTPRRMGLRSVSETEVGLDGDELQPRRRAIQRSSSCSDVEASPEVQSSRPRISLMKPVADPKPPTAPHCIRLGSTDSMQEDPPWKVPKETTVAQETVDKSSNEQTEECEAASMRKAVPSRISSKVKAVATGTKSNRKRKLSSQANADSKVSHDGWSEVASSNCNQAAPTSVPSIRIMFTGLDGTLSKMRDKVKKIVDACQEDDDVEKVTHLIAAKNQLKRTVKLLCGISCCDHILDERWLDESARSGFAASEATHCLKDTAAEAKWGFSLYRTMYDVPKEKRRQLFHGLRFFITNHKSVLPPVKDLVKIVECAGGQAVTKGSATENDVVITSEAALPLATTKKALANANAERVYSSEFILSSILQQQIDFEANRLTQGDSSPGKKKRARRQ